MTEADDALSRYAHLGALDQMEARADSFDLGGAGSTRVCRARAARAGGRGARELKARLDRRA